MYSGMVSVSWENCAKLTLSFWALIQLHHLSVFNNADGAVKFLLFGENSGQP